MDTNIVFNTRVKRRDSSRAVVIAVTARSIFDLEEEEGPETATAANENEPFKMGGAFPFIKALQSVNGALLQADAEETLLFDVMLLCTSCSPHRRSRVERSTVHYDLEISRFCFCGPEDFAESLQANKVKLFLSMCRDDVRQAWEKGVPAALLYPQGIPDSTGPLRVLFVGDVLGLTGDTSQLLTELGFSETQLQHITTAQGATQEFATRVGKMRSKFRQDSSPLCTYLLMAWSPRDACARALKTLRGWGLEPDEAFCLAGAPREPILAHIRPHILLDLQGPRGPPGEG